MTGLFRSIWNAPAVDAPRRNWRDWTAFGIFAGLLAIETLTRVSTGENPIIGIVTLALVPTLLWRRAHPFTMLVIAFATTTLLTAVFGSAEQYVFGIFVIALPFAVFRWGSGRAALGGLGVMIASSLVDAAHAGWSLGDAIAGVTFGLAILGTATAFRFRANARARALETAASNEREQLARDLHDTVAHHVSAIAIRAQAGLATAATDPNAATDALLLIEKEASRALVEMRSLVRTLRRDGTAELAPGAGLTELLALATAPGEKPRVEVTIDGDGAALGATVSAALYRIAQESVTNARRHARHATTVRVALVVADGRAVLTVSNDGERSRQTMGGYGIAGMVERATLLGGECISEPAGHGGWRVRASLPIAQVIA